MATRTLLRILSTTRSRTNFARGKSTQAHDFSGSQIQAPVMSKTSVSIIAFMGIWLPVCAFYALRPHGVPHVIEAPPQQIAPRKRTSSHRLDTADGVRVSEVNIEREDTISRVKWM